MNSIDPEHRYVSRGGLKLEAALQAFALTVLGLRCADLGCNVGGYTDCLLQHGAAHVYSVDTSYGTLAWKLRQDPRVTVLERSNVLHLDPASIPDFVPVSLVAMDLGWTRQALAIPAALRWLAADGQIITLIKPHYEADKRELSEKGERGVLSPDAAQQVCQRVLESLPGLGVVVRGCIPSPILGGKSRGREGNTEFLAWVVRA